MTTCRYCKKDPCEDDCEELQAIYLAHHKEQMKDIDLSDFTGECMSCGCPVEPQYLVCYSCENGLGDRE